MWHSPSKLDALWKEEEEVLSFKEKLKLLDGDLQLYKLHICEKDLDVTGFYLTSRKKQPPPPTSPLD